MGSGGVNLAGGGVIYLMTGFLSVTSNGIISSNAEQGFGGGAAGSVSFFFAIQFSFESNRYTFTLQLWS